MDSSENDRRVTRTKQAIEEAFIACVKEKGFDATKISDIVARANINRGTFYLHYQDKYDFKEKLEDSTVADLKAQVVRAKKRYNLDKSDLDYGYEYLFRFILNYMKKHKDRIQILFSLGGENSFRHKLQELLLENLTEELYPAILQENLQVPVVYWSIYMASADIGVIEYWLGGGCKESIDEIARILTSLFFAKI